MSQYHLCTKDDPFNINIHSYGYHKDAEEIYSCDDYERLACPHCKTTWKRYWEDMK